MSRITLIAALLLAHTAGAQVSSPYFPTDLGWSWTFVSASGSQSEQQIVGTTSIRGREVVERRNMTSGGAEYYSIAPNGDVLYHGSRYNLRGSYFDPPIVVLKADAIVGSTWTTSSQDFCERDGIVIGGSFRSYTCSVVAAETIEVPAGTFETLKVRSTEYIGCDGDHQLGYIYTWYAVGLGPVQLEVPLLHQGVLSSLVSWHAPQVDVESSPWGTVKSLYR